VGDELTRSRQRKKMEDQEMSVEARLAKLEEALRHLAARLGALEERVEGRTEVVVDELDDLRTEVEYLKDTDQVEGNRLLAPGVEPIR
jgi:hypothetical protein